MQHKNVMGQVRDHGPRCKCPDCTTKYAQHNQHEHCGCGECAGYREGMTFVQPETTRDYRVISGLGGAYLETVNTTRLEMQGTNIPSQKGKNVSSGQIFMCMREGCESLVVNNAAGVVSLDPGAMGAPEAGEQTNYTLCPLCQYDVDSVLHSAPLDDRPRKQNKPYGGWDTFREDDAVATASVEQLAAELLRRLGTKALDGPSTKVDGE